jgi:hypothetical protein
MLLSNSLSPLHRFLRHSDILFFAPYYRNNGILEGSAHLLKILMDIVYSVCLFSHCLVLHKLIKCSSIELLLYLDLERSQ